MSAKLIHTVQKYGKYTFSESTSLLEKALKVLSVLIEQTALYCARGFYSSIKLSIITTFLVVLYTMPARYVYS